MLLVHFGILIRCPRKDSVRPPRRRLDRSNLKVAFPASFARDSRSEMRVERRLRLGRSCSRSRSHVADITTLMPNWKRAM